jgi:hypothetical protein
MDTRVIVKRLRVGVALACVLAAFTLWLGCDNTAEGDRCNPDLSHDECSNGPTIQCVQVNALGSPLPDGGAAPCNGEAYCCAVDSTGLPTSSAANCQALRACAIALTGSGTPTTPDAGALDAGSPETAPSDPSSPSPDGASGD